MRTKDLKLVHGLQKSGDSDAPTFYYQECPICESTFATTERGQKSCSPECDSELKNFQDKVVEAEKEIAKNNYAQWSDRHIYFGDKKSKIQMTTFNACTLAEQRKKFLYLLELDQVSYSLIVTEPLKVRNESVFLEQLSRISPEPK